MKKLAFVADSNSLQFIESTSNFVNVVSLLGNAAQSFVKPTAQSTLTFTTNFVVGDTVSFGGGAFGGGSPTYSIGTTLGPTLTAVASGPTALQFVPGVSLTASLTALAAQFNALTGVNAVSPTATIASTATTLVATTAISATPVNCSAYKVSAEVIAVSLSTGARFCRLSAGALFYFSTTNTATIAGSSNSLGTASISVPATVQPWFSVEDVATVSVIAPSNCVVSAEYWS